MIHTSPLQQAVINALRAAPEPLRPGELAAMVNSTRRSVQVRIRHLRIAGCDRIETLNCGYHDQRYRWRA